MNNYGYALASMNMPMPMQMPMQMPAMQSANEGSSVLGLIGRFIKVILVAFIIFVIAVVSITLVNGKSIIDIMRSIKKMTQDNTIIDEPPLTNAERSGKRIYLRTDYKGVTIETTYNDPMTDSLAGINPDTWTDEFREEMVKGVMGLMRYKGYTPNPNIPNWSNLKLYSVVVMSPTAERLYRSLSV